MAAFNALPLTLSSSFIATAAIQHAKVYMYIRPCTCTLPNRHNDKDDAAAVDKYGELQHSERDAHTYMRAYTADTHAHITIKHIHFYEIRMAALVVSHSTEQRIWCQACNIPTPTTKNDTRCRSSEEGDGKHTHESTTRTKRVEHGQRMAQGKCCVWMRRLNQLGRFTSQYRIYRHVVTIGYVLSSPSHSIRTQCEQMNRIILYEATTHCRRETEVVENEEKKKFVCEIYSRPTHKCQRHSFLYALPFVVVVVSMLDDSYFFFFFFPFCPFLLLLFVFRSTCSEWIFSFSMYLHKQNDPNPQIWNTRDEFIGVFVSFDIDTQHRNTIYNSTVHSGTVQWCTIQKI